MPLMRQESEFYPRAKSHVGAAGMMQLMPGTAEDMAAREGIEYVQSDLLDNPSYNVRLGTSYLDEMLHRFEGRLPLVALSYNAGPRRASQWLEHNGPLGNDVHSVVRWIEMIPFDETRNYVQRVLEATLIYDAKLRNGFGYYKPSDLLLGTYPKGRNYSPSTAPKAVEVQ